jgi:D-alanyl-D-alanine dipeptidase
LLAWAVVFAVFGVACLAIGEPIFDLAGHQAAAGWNSLLVLTGIVAAATSVRQRPGRIGRALPWVGFALAAVSAFGVLMDVVSLAFGQGVDSTAGAVHHVLGLVGLLLLASTVSGQQAAGPKPCRPRGSRAAPTGVRRTAYLGVAAWTPYVLMKQTWVWGGTFAGLSGAQMLTISERNGASDLWLALESVGLDATVLMAALGAGLILALVSARGQRVPRWLLLGPALVGVGTLVPYGIAGLAYVAAGAVGVVSFPKGDFPSTGDAFLVSWIGLGSFFAYGAALAVVAASYWRRTNPR